jgi:hypothetical protein
MPRTIGTSSRSLGVAEDSVIGDADFANVGMLTVRTDCPELRVNVPRPNSVIVHTSPSNHT